MRHDGVFRLMPIRVLHLSQLGVRSISGRTGGPETVIMLRREIRVHMAATIRKMICVS